MIDLSTKQSVVAVDMRPMRKSQPLRSGRRKNEEKPYNLPQNIPGSESDEYESGCSSDDQNDMVDDNVFSQDYAEHNLTSNELNFAFKTFSIKERQSSRKKKVSQSSKDMEVVMKKLSTLVSSYQDCKKTTTLQEPFDEDLKARSPIKKTSHRPAPYDTRMTVNTNHGNGGHVLIQHSPEKQGKQEPCSTKSSKSFSNEPGVPSESETNLSSPLLSLLLDALDDPEFMESWKRLSIEDASIALQEFSDKDYMACDTMMNERPQSQNQSLYSTSPEQTAVRSPDTNFSMSPASNDDSCYGTGSPGSEVVTSPGSPAHRHRSSLSSESDQELDENHSEGATLCLGPVILVTDNSSLSPLISHTVDSSVVKQGQNQVAEIRVDKTLKPFGDAAVSCVAASASQRLYELSKSTSFCVKHFTIQLVRVVMSTKTEIASDKIQGFCKSLLSTMKTKLGTKTHEGDIWQLAIYAHIQFLMARVQEYKGALLSRDERGLSLLYIAVFERVEKPLIARYIAESMAEAGYDPQAVDMDEHGNTILHLVARLGDSHINVLSELLMATGADGQLLFSVHKSNRAGQTPLHLAAQSPHPHLSTILMLLKQGANPLIQDLSERTALHYHVLQASRWLPRRDEDFTVVRKMLLAPLSLAQHLEMLKKFCADSTTPPDFRSYILKIVQTFSAKDQKPKKK